MKEGDLVIYFATGEIKVGRFVNTTNKRLIIIPKIGKRVTRAKSQVASLPDLIQRYGNQLKGNTNG